MSEFMFLINSISNLQNFKSVEVIFFISGQNLPDCRRVICIHIRVHQ